MQATLPVRTFNMGWFAGFALALGAAIVVSAALVLAAARPAAPAAEASRAQAVQQAVMQHLAGERESLLTNTNVVDEVLIDHRGGVPQSLYSSSTIDGAPAASERDEGLGSSVNAPSDPRQVWSGNPGRAEAQLQPAANGSRGLKPQ